MSHWDFLNDGRGLQKDLIKLECGSMFGDSPPEKCRENRHGTTNFDT